MFSEPFQLLDLTQIDDNLLRSRAWVGIAALVMKYRSTADVMPFFRKLLPDLVHIEQDYGSQFVINLIEYMINVYHLDDDNAAEFAQLAQTELSPETGEQVMTFAQYYENKGLERGRQMGMEKGMEKGLEKGIEEGMEKGLEIGLKIVAKRLLEQGTDPQQIASLTGLPQSLIETLNEDKIS